MATKVSTELLIDAIKNYSQLFDTTHPRYKDASHKKEIWDHVAKELGVSSRSLEMSMISVILLASTVSLFLWVFFHFLDEWLLRKRVPPGTSLPPMPPASSIFGHVELMRLDFHREKCLVWAKKYGPVIRLRVNFQNIVILNDYENIKKFCNTKEILGRWPSFVGYHDKYNGLNEMNGETWTANRRFCMSMLREVGFAKTAMEGRMMEEFRRVTDSIGHANGKPVDLSHYTATCTFNNVVSFFFGDQLTHDYATARKLQQLLEELRRTRLEGRNHEFLSWKLRRLLAWLPFTKSHRVADLLAELHAVSAEQIEIYKAAKSGSGVKDFVLGYTRKIEESKNGSSPSFTDDYLVGNVNVFLTGGVVTTSLTMTWHMINFARNPDTVQARVQREIDDVVGDERLPTWEDRKRMPYTLACVWEMSRWKTVAPRSVSRACAEDVVVGDYFIPKGTVIIPNLWAVHNDPTLWKDPEKFVPERYLNEDGTLVSHKPEHLIPFSIGRRDCPGQTFATMEIFLLITFLLQKYRILPEQPSDFDLNSPEIAPSYSTKVKLRFVPRKNITK